MATLIYFRKFTNAGFTLVEVMVALMILAISLSALQFKISQHVNNSAYLRDKTVASWVAQNRLELLRLESRLLNSVNNEIITGTETMAGKQWLWQVIPQILPGQGEDANLIVPVEIIVAESTAPEFPFITLIGVTDAWHRLQ